jgi:hypothetical protein
MSLILALWPTESRLRSLNHFGASCSGDGHEQTASSDVANATQHDKLTARTVSVTDKSHLHLSPKTLSASTLARFTEQRRSHLVLDGKTVSVYAEERMKFWQHPLNRLVGDYAVYLYDKEESGQITTAESADIMRHGIAVVTQAGLPNGPEADEITLAVYRQQLHVRKKRLLELHPELGDEVRNMPSGQQRYRHGQFDPCAQRDW